MNLDSPAYTEAWRLFSRHALVSVPLSIERDENGGKRVQPLSKFKHLWDAEPTDDVIEELWNGHRDAPGLAVLLTESAGLLALDTDSDEATDWAFELVKKTRTPTIMSRRGFKWLFQLNGAEMRSSSGMIRKDVDIKVPNALVVVPPTDGYAWQASLSLDDVAVAPVPKSLTALLTTVPKRPRDNIPGDDPVPIGRRHDTLVSLAGAMRRRDMDIDAILAALRVTNAKRCQPPVEDNEVVKIAQSADWKPDIPLPRATSSSPSTELADVHETFREHLYMPEPAALDAAIASFVAHRMGGDPVWLLLVGAPSGGKTEIIRAFKLPEVHEISSLTAQTFASGMNNKPTASLLSRLDRDGKTFLTYKDLTTVLTLHRDARSEILAQLREIYDGAFTKEFGNGQTVAWEGRLGFLAGVTNAIDTHHAVTAILGERFLYLRLPSADRQKLARQALDQSGREPEIRSKLCAVVSQYVNNLDLTRTTAPSAELIIGLADFTTRARSGVVRDYHAGGDIAEVPQPEVPARCAKALLGVGRALEVMGHGDPAALLRRIAYDSVPPRRLAVLRVIRASETPLGTSEVADAVALPTSSARRTLEELKALSLVEREKANKRDDLWRLSVLCIEVWAKVDPA